MFTAKHFEIVSTVESGFTREKIESVLNDLPCNYAYILHDKDILKDGNPKPPHWHVYVNFGKTSWQSDRLAKRFGVAENFVSKIKGRASDMLDYLTHANTPEKHQYEDEEVYNNFDWKKVRETSKARNSSEKRANEIRENIVSGTWRDYNIHNYVNAEEFYKHKRVIDSALDFRIRILKGANRDMKCVYIYGDSGTGKSTLAKDIALNKGYSVYISSGSNDVLDDYRGEDCIILDDLRPSCMGLADLLKMLDPNTSSTVKSRYRNKVLECKMIIITTTLPIEKFFAGVFDSKDETSVQLMRRCQVRIKLTAEIMVQSVWNPAQRKYMVLPAITNPVAEKYKPIDLTPEDAMRVLTDIVGKYGVDEEQLHF